MGSGISSNKKTTKKNTMEEPKNSSKQQEGDKKDTRASDQADQGKKPSNDVPKNDTKEKPKSESILGRKKHINEVPEFVFHSDKDLLFGADIALPWQESYALGVHIIDEQHKMLVKLINELAEAVRDGHMRYEIGSVFDNLVEYTDFHFKKEEELMAKYQYTEDEESVHKERHSLFIKKVFDLRQDFINMTVNNIGQDLLDFLTDWLLTHICQTDKKLCDFLLERNINDDY